MASVPDFISAVTQSRLLTQAQKQEFLEDPESLPEDYRDGIIAIVTEFDAHSAYRDRIMLERLEKTYKQFEQKLIAENITGEEKKQLLSKARKQIRSFFPSP